MQKHFISKRVLASIALPGFLFSAWALPLTPERALERALSSPAPVRIQSADQSAWTLSRKVTAPGKEDGEAQAYLFETDGKFIFVSADDCCESLLGYGDSALATEEGQMAPGFEYWISEIARQIEARVESGALTPAPKTRSDRAPIEPLVSTRWGQGNPYNLKCPPRKGDEKAVTGCVATAMSQVMKYHNWPPAGEGKITYTSNKYGELRVNLDNTPFDWANMLDRYVNEDWTEEQATAVATLMMCAGYSVQMAYSPTGSGALSIYIAPAFGNYFKYDKSLQYAARDYYSSSQWEEMIYSCLATYGPVVYDGQGSAGGHSFVCDGYSSDGYFHINWGWNGVSDGYFLLDALDPEALGTGGGAGGFNYDQDAILNLRPATEGSPTQMSTDMLADGPFKLAVGEEPESLKADFGFYNYGPANIGSGEVGFRYTPVDNNHQAIEGEEAILDLYEFEDLSVLYGFKGLETSVADLEDGRYKVEVVYNIEGGSYRLPLFPYATSSFGYMRMESGIPQDFEQGPWQSGVKSIVSTNEEDTRVFTLSGLRDKDAASHGIRIIKGKKILK